MALVFKVADTKLQPVRLINPAGHHPQTGKDRFVKIYQTEGELSCLDLFEIV